ncbi:MAG: succinate dehydrogenase, hydrophobic membrane anchor protein [Pseudomonadota bacterium]
MQFLTDRKRVVGLGSAGHGTHHHWQMMISSMLLGILVPAFVVTFALGLGGTYDQVLAYYGQPLPALITALTLVVGVWHLMNEVNGAIEDYVHGLAGKLSLIAVTSLSYGLIGVGLFAVARLAL